jgi:hypothetical protein
MEQMLFQGLIGVPLEDVTHGLGETGGACCSFVPLQGATSPPADKSLRAGADHVGLERAGLERAGLERAGLEQGLRERPVVTQCGKSHCDCH